MVDQFGNYLVEEQIADGGIGRVLRGRHELLDRSVAIKVLHERYAADAHFRERFLREARAMAALDHPNIVHVFDFGEDAGRFYLVMELVEGGSVRELLDATGGQPLDLDLALDLTRQVAQGLAYAHDHGMVHRDIKPGNLLIDQRRGSAERVVKITDFGLVRVADSATVTAAGVTLGTAAYMSPEQCAGGEIDLRSDIYSLGVVLFELLTGELPFSGASAPEIAERHVRERPPAPRDRNPRIPDPINDIVLRCLAKSPLSRFQHCDDLLAALDGVQATGNQPTRQIDAVSPGTAVDLSTQPEDDDGEAEPIETAIVETLAALPAARALTLTVDPTEATGTWTQRYRLTVEPDGQTTARLALLAEAPDERLRVRIKPGTLVVAPDVPATAELSIYALPRFGRDEARIPLEVWAESVGGYRTETTATFVHRPLATSWLPLAAGGALVALVICLLAGAAFGALTGSGPFGIGGGESDTLALADATGRVARYEPSGDLRTAFDVAGEVERITGVAVSESGVVYLADGAADRIVKVDEDGEVIAAWGESGAAPGQLSGPADLAVARDGSVYVVDTGNDRIQVFNSDGGFVAQYGATGDEPGQFDAPAAIAFDSVGNFYVADAGNDRVQKLQSFGAFLLAWGKPGSAAGEFADPDGLAVDGQGNVYVADVGNRRIQKFDFDGNYLTSWTGEGDAVLEQPGALAIHDGRLYVADRGRVVVFDLDGEFRRFWPGSGAESDQFDSVEIDATP